MTKLETLITEQQKGKKGKPAWMIGEQLKEIAAREPVSAELLERDLQIPEMTLDKAADKLKDYADENHQRERVFCVTPDVAEKILREFYGLPERDKLAEPGAAPAGKPKIHVDLADYM